MITANNNFVVVTGSKTFFSSTANVHSVPTVHDIDSTVYVEVFVLPTATSTDSTVFRHNLQFTYSAILAFTASGADEIAKFYNQVEQAIKNYLGGLSENSGVTFTIS